MTIPFLNLKALHDPLRDEFNTAIQEVIDSNAFAGGPFVKKFEDDFASYCNCQHAVGVGSGTDALWLALMALGIGPGDEVITVPNTFIATAEAITYCGARPVFVDIDEATYNLNPALLEGAITEKTKAIIPVHLYGQIADMDPILDVARRHNLFVIEDAAQAHGAGNKGRRAGTFGDAACFSFYPGKNLGAFGEAGAVVTNNQEIAEKIRVLREHGQAKKYHHDLIGWNCRMDGLQAAVLQIKLKHLDHGNSRRRENGHRYTAQLRGIDGVITPIEADQSVPVYHLYVVRVKDRDGLMNALKEKGIGTGIHYPVPLHLTGAYQNLGLGPGTYPVTERCAAEIVSLPMFPDLTPDQVDTVCREVKAFVESGNA